MAKRFIVSADKFVMCVAWVLVSVIRLIILPLHFVSLGVFKGCESIAELSAEMHAATVARIKAE